MKNAEKLEAIKLRKDEGLSLKEIAEKLKVAKSTVSLWVRNVELTQEQKNKLLEQNPIFNNQQKGIKKIKEQALVNYHGNKPVASRINDRCLYPTVLCKMQSLIRAKVLYSLLGRSALSADKAGFRSTCGTFFKNRPKQLSSAFCF